MLKKLMGSIREYKRDTILSPVFVSLEVIMEVLIPVFMAKLIDEGITPGDSKKLFTLGGILIVFCIFTLMFGMLSGKHAAQASAGFAKNLRHDMFYNVQRYSFSNIDRLSAASIVTRLTTDVTNVQNSYQMIIRIVVRAPLMMIFSLVMAFYINASLAWIFLVAIPILGVGLYFIMTRVHPIFKKTFKIYDRLNDVVRENLRGIRVVKSFVREEHEENKFKEVSTNLYNSFCKAEKLLVANMPLMQFLVYTCILLISWLGAQQIVGLSMTTGELTSLLTYTMQILMSLMMISMIIVMLTMSKASAERIVEILDEEPDIKNPAKPVMEVANGDIEFKNVSYSYNGDMSKCCLENINLKIKSGETIGIIGGTGSGKSTLVSLISRLYDATAGTVKVGDVDVKDYDMEVLRDGVAVVLQKNVLFSGTIRSNLKWGNADATDEEIRHVCHIARADEFIETKESGYDSHVEQGGANFSGGQKQRLCIARALLKKPKILILDDSTSAVDTKTDAFIRSKLREEIPGTTKIIIAQRVSSISDADKIIVMENGKIDGIGTHDELLKTNEIYKSFVKNQRRDLDVG